MILPLRVERDDLVHYFLSPKQAAYAINAGIVWSGHTISSPRIYQVARATVLDSFSIKGFIMSNVTREDFLDWYYSATMEEQLLSIPPVETRRKQSK
jgi:hypothetical protein